MRQLQEDMPKISRFIVKSDKTGTTGRLQDVNLDTTMESNRNDTTGKNPNDPH